MDRIMVRTKLLVKANFKYLFINGFLLGPQEYCQDETFVPKCKNNEVIMITKAQFGRMEIGKCVNKDLGKFALLPLFIKFDHITF